MPRWPGHASEPSFTPRDPEAVKRSLDGGSPRRSAAGRPPLSVSAFGWSVMMMMGSRGFPSRSTRAHPVFSQQRPRFEYHTLKVVVDTPDLAVAVRDAPNEVTGV